MGRESRNNPIAKDAKAGKLLSRATIIGAMDHALEIHASALRLADERIKALDQRVTALEKPSLAFHPKAFETVIQGLPTPTLDQIVEAQPGFSYIREPSIIPGSDIRVSPPPIAPEDQAE